MQHFFPPVRRHSTAEAVEGAVTETAPDTRCCLSAELILSSHRFTAPRAPHSVSLQWKQEVVIMLKSHGLGNIIVYSPPPAPIALLTSILQLLHLPQALKKTLCCIFLDISRASTKLFLCTNPTASLKNRRVEPLFLSCGYQQTSCPRWRADRPAGGQTELSGRRAGRPAFLFPSFSPSALLECVCAAGQTRRCASASVAQSGPLPSPSPPPSPRCTLSDRTAASCFTLIHFQRESLLFFHRSPFPYKQR